MPQKKEKRPVFELLLRDYARQHSCVLIGDFNTGKTAADIVGSKLRFSCEDMFCDIESSMTDAWRHFYPERRHFSWDYFKGGAVLSRWRIDHAFLSPDLVSRLQFCEYDDAFRVRAPDGSMLLSDHSGLMLKLL
jgi:exonuclease III